MTVAGAVAAIAVLGAGGWLIARREAWARDIYQLPDNGFGRGVVAALGVALIAAVVVAVVEALS